MKFLQRQHDGPLTRELLLKPAAFGLGHLPADAHPDAVARTICGYCSTGCGLDVHLKGDVAVGLTPTSDHPVNLGVACPKGWEALTVLDSSDRATTPLLRSSSGHLEPVDWDTALRQFTSRFQAIQSESGADAVAFLGTGQMVTEEMAFLGALTKFGMGIRHGDGNTRQCMATSVVAYKQAFGFDAPPYTYQDFEESDVIVLIGSNMCIAHPIMWERVMRNPHDPRIVVVDPRMTETAMQANLHLPVAPKSDLTLLYGIARLLIEHDWIDQRFISESTHDFDQFAQFVKPFTVERVAAETGLDPAAVEQFARIIHEGKRVSFWWTMGVNQSHQGVRTAQAIINLSLMTGNIGRPGTGANSITGQCNAMGARLFSNTTNLLGGHDFANEADRKKIARILDIDPAVMPTDTGWAYNEIMEGILRGRIRGLWVVCTNPAHSWINQTQCLEILERLDFLVVQDMYSTTETARMADLVLPAAGWGEKEGTFINSERRIGAVQKVARPPGEAISDFDIFRLVADYWGCADMFRQWESPAAVFDLLKQCSTDQPCDFTGIKDAAQLVERGGIQWPYPHNSTDDRDQRRLFENGRFYHADERARFLFEEPRPLPELANTRYPFTLLTGRGSVAQWHTQTRTSKSAVLEKLSPSVSFAEVNPADAKQLGIAANDWIVITSQRGRIRVCAFLTNAVQPGQVFVPMHAESTNRLTDAVFDPYSKQPAYKACAVRVERAGG